MDNELSALNDVVDDRYMGIFRVPSFLIVAGDILHAFSELLAVRKCFWNWWTDGWIMGRRQKIVWPNVWNFVHRFGHLIFLIGTWRVPSYL